MCFYSSGSTASDVELFVTDCQGTACTVKKGSTIEVIIDFTPSESTVVLIEVCFEAIQNCNRIEVGRNKNLEMTEMTRSFFYKPKSGDF